jgi:peptidoglycan L-alanyl-D-glutamate endopeptidase CwlK
VTFVLGARSLDRLHGVHPDLVRVVKRAIALSTQDFMVLEGVRTVARQHELYGQGRTAAQCRAAGVDPRHAKPGRQVTWTLKSNHFAGRAVDLVPWPIDWNTPAKFNAISRAMFAAAKELGVSLRWGADWDEDGISRERGESDSPHFELDKDHP